MSKIQISRTYRAYNLEIYSELLLPELPASAEVTNDVIIRVEDTEQMISDTISRPEFSYSITPTIAQLDFAKVGKFLIKEGREITVRPLPGIEESLVRLPLLGAALAVLLYQRGKFVLHASAIAINGEAVAFVGNKGDGKSTMAAMLSNRGHQLLSDDTAAIDYDHEQQPIVLPGFPQIKLYPDSVVAALNDDPETMERTASIFDKRSSRPENFCNVSLPLKAIYVLGVGEEVQIKRLNIHESIRNLIAHSYMARFTSEWMNGAMASSNLKQCVAIASRIPIYMLERPRELSKLETVATIVEEQTETMMSATAQAI